MGTRGMLGLKNTQSKKVYKDFKHNVDKEIADVIIEIEQMREKAEQERKTNDKLLPFHWGEEVLYK